MQACIRWSLLWRSVLLFPLGAVMGLAVVAFPLLALVLPVVSVALFASGSWLLGGAALGMMIPVIAVRRWLARTVASDYCWPDRLP